MKLSQLAALPCEMRVEPVLAAWWPSLAEALVLAGQQGVGLDPISPPAFGWAVAFNIAGRNEPRQDDPPAQDAPERKATSYLEDLDPSASLEDLERKLTRPIAGRDDLPQSSGLAELAMSVACEQRDDWQHPQRRPIDLAATEQAIGDLLRRYTPYVERFIASRFGHRAGEPRDIAALAWTGMYRVYWSPEATRRFRGNSRIVTTVCSIARFAAIDEMRNRRSPGTGDLEAGHPPALLEPTPPPTPLSPLGDEEDARGFRAAYWASLETLPPKQQFVVDMKFRREMQQKDIAGALGCSEANVSQLLKLALPRFRECLAERGFDPAVSAPSVGEESIPSGA